MSNLMVIEEREVLGKEFRIYGDFDNPLFLAKDVAGWIDHSQPDVMIKVVDDSEKLTLTMFSSGQNREMWFLTEDGLYEVLMQSRKSIAKEFKAQVKQILKDIRKHGAYLTQAKIEEVLLDPDTIIRLATDLKIERERTSQLAAKVESDKPKVIFADSVAASHTSILIGDLAKLLNQNGINMGQNRLFNWLRDNGYLCSRGESKNMPTQYARDLDLIEIKERTIDNPDGSIRTTRTPKITGKGQIYFINKLRSVMRKEAS